VVERARLLPRLSRRACTFLACRWPSSMIALCAKRHDRFRTRMKRTR
jgi:hypothetical protein